MKTITISIPINPKVDSTCAYEDGMDGRCGSPDVVQSSTNVGTGVTLWLCEEHKNFTIVDGKWVPIRGL